MFTGIIRAIGKIQEIQEKNGQRVFRISAANILENKKIGQSMAVNGVCLSLMEIEKDSFKAEAIPETLRKSTLGLAKVDDLVNLEPPLTLAEGLDGHLVQGHVDDIGTVISVKKDGESQVVTIKFPLSLSKFLALKGSITINGVSLTISDLQTDNLAVSLIPQTLATTNLVDLKVDDKVNLEVDMIAKYLDRMLYNKDEETKYEWLAERGFI